MKNILKKKNIVLSIIVIFMGLAIAGGTFAWLTGTLNVTNGNYTASSDCFLIDYNTSELENNIGTNLFSNLTTSGVGITKLDDGSINVDRRQISSGDTYQIMALNSNKVSGGHYVVGFNVSGLEEGQVAVFGIYVSGSGIVGKKTLVNGYNALFFESQNTTNLITLDEYESDSTNDFNINISGFIVYIQSQDITGTMFPTSSPSRGLNGSVGLKVNSSCSTYGTGTIKLHVDSTTSSTLTTPIASYCESKKTLQKIDGISTKSACETANGIWRGYGDSYCENPDTLERITTYTTQSDCESNGGSWQTGGSPLKYAVYNSDDITQNPVSVGHINTSDIGHDITLKDDIVISEVQKYYYIYIWLDGYMTDNSFSNLPFSGSISASAIQDNGRVPSGYQKVEYLESTGTQYINSQISQYNVYGYEIEFQSTGIKKSSNDYRLDGIFGVNNSKINEVIKDTKLWFNYTDTTGGNYIGLRGKYQYSAYTPLNDYYQRHHIRVFNNEVTYDNNYLNEFENTDNAVPDFELYIFAVNKASSNTHSANFYSKTKLYYLKFFGSNNELISYLVPCKNSSNVSGLYDVINNRFLTNAGSGTFNIGPEIY